jgi:hypothetical protein
VLSRWDQEVIAHAYGLGQREVVADVQLIVEGSEPLDDLLVRVCHVHKWNAAGGFRYLRTVRLALLGQLPR